MTIIDGDGHVLEDAEEISRFLPSPYRELGPFALSKLLPPLDHLHAQPFELLPDAFGAGKPVRLAEWRNFMTYTGIQQAVLYPTWALASPTLLPGTGVSGQPPGPDPFPASDHRQLSPGSNDRSPAGHGR